MNKDEIKHKVVKEVNNYLKGKFITEDGPYPYEEFTSIYVTISTLRKALNKTFEETFKLCNENKR